MAIPDYTFYNIINGERRSPQTDAEANESKKPHGSWQHGTDPRTEETLWPCPVASVADLDEAVVAANAAFPAWSQTTVAERQQILLRMARQISEHEAELADILRRETGKSAVVTSIEIINTMAQIKSYSKLSLEDEVQYEDDSVRILATHPPLGVVGAICPWNFPLILCSFKVISALLAGNCVIVKPSPFTPYAVLRWIELATTLPGGGKEKEKGGEEEANKANKADKRPLVPPGVLQVLQGGADLGAAMTAHTGGIHKISFTGTTATGRRVLASCAPTLKRVTLELAGNDAAIVCPDVARVPGRLADAAAQTAAGAFFNAGQMCVATKRIYVHADVYDAFLAHFVEAAQTYAVGDAAAEVQDASLFGPLSNRPQRDAVQRMLDGVTAAAAAGAARIVAGGHAHRGRGFWMEPTVVTDLPEDAPLVQEEQFGPIIPILQWTEEDDVIARANLANAGLGATVYSTVPATARRLADRLEAGAVWINTSEQLHPMAYFGGFKDSGFGGEMGRQGLLSYTYTKSIFLPKERAENSKGQDKSKGKDKDKEGREGRNETRGKPSKPPASGAGGLRSLFSSCFGKEARV